MLWTLLQAGKKEQACEEVKSGRLADAKTLGYQVNDQGLVFPHPICMVRYQCSSDTMDPLGAKGSERRHGGSVLSLGPRPVWDCPETVPMLPCRQVVYRKYALRACSSVG